MPQDSAAQRASQAWGQLPEYSEEFAQQAEARFKSFQEDLRASNRHTRAQRAWSAYYSRGRDGVADETEIEFTGQRGETLYIKPARFRRLIQDQLATVQQTSPEPDPIASNTDPESQSQAHLARGILNYYLQVEHLEDLGVERAEMALVLSESMLHARWDPDRGEEFAPDDQGGTVYTGDFVFSVRSFYEYAYDRTSPDARKARWWVVQEPVDRWDLIAQFVDKEPDEKRAEELRDAILTAPKWSTMLQTFGYRKAEIGHDDSIAVKWVYIEPCLSVPDGRKALIGPGCKVLLDGPMDYRKAGCFWLPAATVMLANESHSPNFDGLPIMEAYAATISTILSNQAAYGGQRLGAARKANVKQYQLDSAISIVEYDHVDPDGAPIPPPAALQLLNTPPEMFSSAAMLREEADVVMAGSPVLRGDPNATKGDSGSKAAMLFAAAQNSSSPFLRAKLRSDSELYTWIIDTQKTHASVERTVAIAGENNRYTVQRYTGKKLERVSRVLVPIANPARDTFQGRMAMAELIIEKPPEVQRQMQALIYTGKLETVTDDSEGYRMLIERENEALRDPTQPVPEVLKFDMHQEHIDGHRACLQDPLIRQDPMLTKRHEDHIAAHMGKITMGHPDYVGDLILLASKQQPLMPPGGKKPGEGPEAEGGPKDAAEDAAEAGKGGGMPNMPSMPKNAATGERMPAMGAQPEGPALS